MRTWMPSSGMYSVRFESLDALRGLAALAVVVHHVTDIHIGGPAVIVFFVISGYCIAAAGASARRNNLGFGKFMHRRVRRIFPPYLLSLALWAAYRLAKWKATGVNELDRSWLEWFQNATLTQWVTLLRHPGDYPPANPTLFVGAYWSLCYEEQFYLVMGLLAGFGLSALVSRWMVFALLVAGLVWNAFFPSVVFGIFIEYWAPFAIGCMVYYRLCELPLCSSAVGTRGPRARGAIDILLLAILGGSIVLFVRSGGVPPLNASGGEVRSIPQDLTVASAVAVLLVLARPFDSRIAAAWLFKPLRGLGQVTFSLYLTHQFNLGIAQRVAALVVGPQRAGTLAGWLISIVFLVCVGAVFWWFCERPFLNKPLAQPAPGSGKTPESSR